MKRFKNKHFFIIVYSEIWSSLSPLHKKNTLWMTYLQPVVWRWFVGNSRIITTREQGCPSDLEIGPDCLTRPRAIDINTRAIEPDSSTLTLTASVNRGKCYIQCWIWRVGYWVWPQYRRLVTWWRVEEQDLLITSKTSTFKPDISAIRCFTCIYVVNCIYEYVSPRSEIKLRYIYTQTTK